LTRLRSERRCDECFRVIEVGELAYVRHHKRYPATYCIDCYEKRRAEWEKAREAPDKKKKMLSILSNGPVPVSDLMSEFGVSYIKIVRKLVFDGYNIRTEYLKDPETGNKRVYYFIDWRKAWDKAEDVFEKK